MENKRKALGKGLEQLFTSEPINFDTIDNFEKEIVKTTKESDILEINIDEIRSNPYQPRTYFDETALQELADSIKEHGVIEPIIVKKSIKGYDLIAGERRTKASRLAGLTTIPAIVKDFTDEQMLELALIENIQREDLTPIEEANAYKNYIEKMEVTQEETAKRFGKSRSYITNLLGLLSLPKYVQGEVSAGKISMSHARVLSKIDDTNLILNLAGRIVNEGLSVRELENLSREDNVQKKHKIVRNEIFNERHKTYETYLRDYIGILDILKIDVEDI